MYICANGLEFVWCYPPRHVSCDALVSNFHHLSPLWVCRTWPNSSDMWYMGFVATLYHRQSGHHNVVSATALSHHTYPSFISAISSMLGLSQKCHMVEIAGGCAAHTVFALPVGPQMFRWRPVPIALGWPSATHATAACDHSGVVLLGGYHISLDCYRWLAWSLPTTLFPWTGCVIHPRMFRLCWCAQCSERDSCRQFALFTNFPEWGSHCIVRKQIIVN